MLNKEKTRRFSLDEDFMRYDTDDLLYGAMQYLATFHKEEKRLYLTKTNFSKRKKDIYALCNLNAQSLKRHLSKLRERGLLEEVEVQCGNKKLESYVFPYDYQGSYQIVDNEMLWYVVSTRNRQAVRIYIYLLNKHLWKQQNGEEYTFTNKELLSALGYSTAKDVNSLLNSAINNILESFYREGIINFEKYYEEFVAENGTAIQIPKKRLVFVANDKKVLRPIDI